jgi:hypothetical protein
MLTALEAIWRKKGLKNTHNDDSGAGAVREIGGWVVEVGSEFNVAGEEGDVPGGSRGPHCCI